MVKSKKRRESSPESETESSGSSETSGISAVGDPSSYESVSESSSEESSETSGTEGSSADEEISLRVGKKKSVKKVKKPRKKKKNKVVTGSISASGNVAVNSNGTVSSVKGQNQNSNGVLSISRAKKSLPFPPLTDLSGKYDKETDDKVANVFNSILDLGEQSKKYMSTLNTATKSAMEQSVKNMQILKQERKKEEAKFSLGKDDKFENYLGLDKLENYFFEDVNEKSTRSSSRKSRVDVSRIYPKLFGLDSMEVLESDESGDEKGQGDESSRSKSMSKKMKELRQILLNESSSGDFQMKKLENTQPDKLFLKSLQRKENSVQKELQKMAKKADLAEKKEERERDGRKSAFEFTAKTANRPPKQVSRLMSSQPSEGPGRELTQFLQKTGGVNGGWSKDEHNFFIKTLKAHRNNTNKIISILTKKIPSLKGEEVICHMDWYEKFEKLEQANKDFVRNWRIEKQKERELIFQMAKEDKKAALAARTRRAEELALRRDSEKEKNRNKLEQWKESKRIMDHKLKEVLSGNVSVTDDPYGPNFPLPPLTTQSIRNNSAIKLKFDQLSRPIGHPMDKKFNLETVKREMERINDLTKQLRRVKTSSELTSIANSGSGKNSASSGSYIERRGQLLSGGRSRGAAGDSSSGLWTKVRSATAIKPREFLHSNAGGKGDVNELLKNTPRSSTSIGLFQNTKSDPMLNKFRERDRKMMEARARAIQLSLDKKKSKPKIAFDNNKKILSGKPSTLLEQTEGSKIREGEIQARLLERHSKFLLSSAAENKNSKNGLSKVKLGPKMHERSIIQPTNIFTIPRLGKPAWRSMN